MVADDQHGRYHINEDSDDEGDRRKPQKGVIDAPMQLLEAVCTSDARLITSIYAELTKLLADPELRELRAKVDVTRVRNDADRPQALFQVAIDMPGYGQSDVVNGSATDGTLAISQFLQEVLTSLGKDHALITCVDGSATGPIMQAISETPKLTSMVAVRQPSGSK